MAIGLEPIPKKFSLFFAIVFCSRLQDTGLERVAAGTVYIVQTVVAGTVFLVQTVVACIVF